MNPLISVRELSEWLGAHPQTIYKLVHENRIPYTRIKGLGIRFRREMIEEWLAKGSPKADNLLEILAQFDLSLEAYDKLFLCKSKKGGVKVLPKGKIWNYPFGSVILRLGKSGKERWHIYYRVDGKRVRKPVKGALSRADALKVLQAEVVDAFRGKHGFKKDPGKQSFRELADRFLNEYAKTNKKSWREDQYRMDAHLKPFFRSLEIQEVNPLLIEKYKTKRQGKGVKNSTINRELALLKSIFSKAVDWGFAEENPVRKVKFFFEKDNAKERVLTKAEEERLMSESPQHLRSVLIFALSTGARRGEILKLKWSQVNLDKGFVRFENTKNGRQRFVPINGRLHEELSKLKELNGHGDAVFPFKSVRTVFENACQRAKIEGLRFHDLRHTFASRLVDRGVDLVMVKELLGHHSVTMTERYVHRNEERKRQAVEVLDEGCPQFVQSEKSAKWKVSPTYCSCMN